MQSTEKKPLTAFTVISTIILLLLTVLFIFPFYWILTGAFKSQPDTIVIPPQWFPKMPTMENFQQLMVQNPALQWMWNSVFISLVTMFLVCATSSLAGYVLAKKRFYGQRILFAIFIAAMALPKQVAALAIFTFINTWNDYFMQLVMLTSRQNLTISLGVATMQAEMATNYGLIMAGAALAAVPIVTVFLVFQKSFTQGITMGAVKG